MTAPLTLRLDSALGTAQDGPLQLAVDLFVPPPGRPPRALLWCLPGGAMNRHYYDLMPPEAPDDISFSFARTLAARGYAVATVDYLGIGDSDRPRDGWCCTPDFLTQANVAALRALQQRLAAGQAHPALPPLRLRSIGVGHSMGGMMTLLQQAADPQHAGIAVLGFSTRGLPDYVPPALRDQDVVALRAQLPALARQAFGEPYPSLQGGRDSRSMFAGRSAEPAGVAALKRASASMLAQTAFMSMLPGNVAPEAAQVRVPVFIGVGENDMAGAPHAIPAAFTACHELRLHIAEGAGHAQFLFASRTRLMAQIADWCDAL